MAVTDITPAGQIEENIFIIRGQRIMIDFDLARLSALRQSILIGKYDGILRDSPRSSSFS